MDPAKSFHQMSARRALVTTSLGAFVENDRSLKVYIRNHPNSLIPWDDVDAGDGADGAGDCGGCRSLRTMMNCCRTTSRCHWRRHRACLAATGTPCRRLIAANCTAMVSTNCRQDHEDAATTSSSECVLQMIWEAQKKLTWKMCWCRAENFFLILLRSDKASSRSRSRRSFCLRISLTSSASDKI